MDDPRIEIWRPKTNSDLGPIEVLAIVNGKDKSYRTRPVGDWDWHTTLSARVLNAYYEPTGEFVEVA